MSLKGRDIYDNALLLIDSNYDFMNFSFCYFLFYVVRIMFWKKEGV